MSLAALSITPFTAFASDISFGTHQTGNVMVMTSNINSNSTFDISTSIADGRTVFGLTNDASPEFTLENFPYALPVDFNALLGERPAGGFGSIEEREAFLAPLYAFVDAYTNLLNTTYDTAEFVQVSHTYDERTGVVRLNAVLHYSDGTFPQNWTVDDPTQPISQSLSDLTSILFRETGDALADAPMPKMQSSIISDQFTNTIEVNVAVAEKSGDIVVFFEMMRVSSYGGLSGIRVEIIDENRLLPGDVNVDGVVDGVDALVLRAHLNGTFLDRNFPFGHMGINADVNRDNTIDEQDLELIRMYLAGHDVVLQEQENLPDLN